MIATDQFYRVDVVNGVGCRIDTEFADATVVIRASGNERSSFTASTDVAMVIRWRKTVLAPVVRYICR